MRLKENIESTKIPDYSSRQELFNYSSHFLGLPLALFIIGFGIFRFASAQITLLELSGLIVFGVSAFIVFLVSSIYHITKRESSKKKLLRIIDHCTIYLLIAGTYTPVCFNLFQADKPYALGIFMLVFQWVGVIAGIILNAFFFQSKVSRVISFVLYVLMGWLALICGAVFHIHLYSFILILVGGIIYTIGSIIYACGHSHKWLHFIFHIFVLLGFITQAIGVFLLH